MQRNEDVRRTLDLSFPKIPAHKAVCDYLTSKSCLDKIQLGGWNWDKPGDDPSLQLASCRRVLQKMTDKLNARRNWSQKEKIKLKTQWDELYEQELEFKDTFKRMAEFLKTNHDKRVRAEKNYEINAKLAKERIRDVEELQDKMKYLLDSKKLLDEKISALKKYELYLNSVVDVADFTNADDLIARYDSLSSTKKFLGQRQSANLKELETARVKTTKLVEEYKFKLMGLNNIVADLRARYNVISTHALHWETLVLNIRRRCYETFQEVSKVKQSCWNTYLLMCKRKNIAPKLGEGDVEHQLMFIKKTLQELNMVNDMIRNEAKSKKPSRKQT